jgi:ribose transport system permease protein
MADPTPEADPRRGTSPRLGDQRPDEGDPQEGVTRRWPVRTWLSRSSLLFVIALLIVGFTIASPHTFLLGSNFTSLFYSNATLLLLALAVTTTLRVGDFDLSVSATMVLTAAISALMVEHGDGALPAMAVALACGLTIGLLNGLLVVVAKLDGFVATLGSMTVITGIGYAVTGQNIVVGYSGTLVKFSTLKVLGLSGASLWGWLVALLLLYVFECTLTGRSWLFVGGNREAARLLAMPVKRLRVAAYVTSGVLSGFAGIVLAGSIGSVDPSSGGEYLLVPFAAAFLGTVAITPGRFNVVGAVLGLYTLAIAQLGLDILGVPTWFSNVFSGGTLIVALMVAALSSAGPLAGVGPRLKHIRSLRVRAGRGRGGVTPGAGQVPVPPDQQPG